MSDEKCIICGQKHTTSIFTDKKKFSYKCSQCGDYYAESSAKEYLESIPNPEFFKKAPSIAYERKFIGQDGYCLTWDEKSKQIYADGIPFLDNYPKTFPEKLDRTLLNIARKANFEPKQIFYAEDEYAPFFVSETVGAGNPSENRNLVITSLIEQGYLKQTKPAADIRTASTPKNVNFSLTLRGICKALELRGKAEANEHAFLAMWFDNSLDNYVTMIRDAVKQAGYYLHIVKDEPHNDFIMERVLNLIRDSRFVIADLTSLPEVDEAGQRPSRGVRGGVYFEAGFALGMGLPVILTCRDDSPARDRIHFDLAQRSTIFWKENNGTLKTSDKDFVETLKEHIIFTVGRGPLPEK